MITTEYGIIFHGELHRGPMSKSDALRFIREFESDGGKPGVFLLATREVAEWRTKTKVLTSTPTSDDILNCPMQENDAGAKTVREYLLSLAKQVWIEEEGFSGKRPFGNSGWSHEVYNSLAEEGIVESEEDDWGDKVVSDIPAVDKLIVEAIRSMNV